MDNFRIYGQDNLVKRTKYEFPAWFKTSFFDLKDDLAQAKKDGKRGIIVMLSQEYCTTCKAFLRTTFSDPDIKKQVLAKYDVIGMDIFGDEEVTTPDGMVTNVRNFADKQSARLTPTLLFFGTESALLVKIIGFYPPEKFQLVLDYINGNHYQSTKLGDYLRDKRIKTATVKKYIIKHDPLFSSAHDLSSRHHNDGRPLLVVFESPDCSACLRFHQRVMTDKNVRKRFAGFRAVQLDAADNRKKIITPDGRSITPKNWFNELQLSYDIAVVFFDENGNEVLRLDSEFGKVRMDFTMEYVLEKGYQEESQVLRWRKKKNTGQLESKRM